MVGLKGDLINYVSHISVNGCDYCIMIEDNIIWVNLSSENTLLEIFYPDDISTTAYGKHGKLAIKIADRVGWN